MFLSADELRELTGYQRASAQCRWLTSRGWKFVISGLQKPVVLRRHAEELLSVDLPVQTSIVREPQLRLKNELPSQNPELGLDRN